MTREEIEHVERLEEAIGYAFPNRRLALTALTHKSWVNEHRAEGYEDNERLEFLGDAVLDLVVSEHLMRALPEAREGRLSQIRAGLVSADGLSRVAARLALGGLLRLGKGEESSGGRKKPSLLADVFEAVVGAIYLADGLEAARDFVERTVLASVDLHAPDAVARRDWKTRLQERAQADAGQTPRYRLVAETGPDHDKRFETEVLVGGRVLGRGRGRTKKDAEQAAAQQALRVLEAGLDRAEGPAQEAQERASAVAPAEAAGDEGPAVSEATPGAEGADREEDETDAS